MSDEPTEPNYHCPVCETLSELVIGPTQAFCTNTTGCPLLTFNPSLPDRGMSLLNFINVAGKSEEK